MDLVLLHHLQSAGLSMLMLIISPECVRQCFHHSSWLVKMRVFHHAALILPQHWRRHLFMPGEIATRTHPFHLRETSPAVLGAVGEHRGLLVL